ncbi:hypothetical protein A28LD_0279 [Idiomarina sp. A28L]|uniref:DUF1249 domain-containing protein n=1 Tax=Idiomarina sp. A28L TaxID=1036674 RepID=UPI00021388F4|nr:DUF1249 domain-containing protein [Idiomarina sp. A28L]EGN76199.1 hypothetical protein A28LD_0279 [Idiomarina sp. A28L]
MKKRYVPNLQEIHSLAERNYAAFARLLGERSTAENMQPELAKHIHVGEQLAFTVVRKAEARYTTDLVITQVAPDVADYLQARFLVRLYHDAKMAEIIDYQGQERLTALHPANLEQARHQKDEKFQLNRHLAEWLRLCFRQGRVPLQLQFVN